jgi:hypothetical protein
VLAGNCPNLLQEAALHRQSTEMDERHAETPLDEHNHALAALRYLVTRLDERCMARVDRERRAEEKSVEEPRKERRWLNWSNETLWTRLS